MGQLFAQASSYTHPPLMPPRTHVLVTCSEIERANHSWEVFWDPPRLYLVSGVLFWGPQIVRALPAFTFCTYAVCFMLPVARALLSVLCRSGTFMLSGHARHTFGPLGAFSRRRKPLGPSSEFGTNFVPGSLLGWLP